MKREYDMTGATRANRGGAPESTAVWKDTHHHHAR